MEIHTAIRERQVFGSGGLKKEEPVLEIGGSIAGVREEEARELVTVTNGPMGQQLRKLAQELRIDI